MGKRMRMRSLVLRGLSYYWRTNLAVVLGVATAVAVLAGALLVGESVRGSLRDLVLARLGKTDRAVMSTGFFREALADDLRAAPSFESSFVGVCPLIQLQGVVTNEGGDRRVQRVLVYGVDDRFWQFHEVTPAATLRGDRRESVLSAALARGHVLALESEAGLLDSARSEAAERAASEVIGSGSASAAPVFTYLANSLRSGGREVPYSLVTATDLQTIAPRSNVDATQKP